MGNRFSWVGLIGGLLMASCDREQKADGWSGPQSVNRPAPSEMVDDLVYLKDESVGWLVDFGLESGGQWFPRLKGLDGDARNRRGFEDGLNPGDLFFSAPPMEKRFKFIGIEEREVHNERISATEIHHVALFEDQDPHKKGTRYEIPDRIPRAQIPRHIQYDRIAWLGVGEAAAESEGFRVHVDERFALPPDASTKQFLLKEVKPEWIVVGWEEKGEARMRRVPLAGRR